MLKLEHVSKYYHNNGVTTKGLDDISVEFNKGEVVAITGESGSGKSTLLNIISNLDTYDDGEIYFKGNETSYFNVLDMDQFRKNKISFIFQNYNIIESYTVLENVMVPLMINGISKKEAKNKAFEILKKVNLTDRASNRGTQLSGGEKQRCVIARALALDTPIIACDEPTGNLDQKTGREIMELICSLSKEKLVLIVTHNFDEISDLATRKIKIHDGKIVEDIKFKEFSEDTNEELILDYLPISKKVDLNIAFSNLLSTPKKTIFSFLVFLVIAFFSLNIFQSVANSNYSNSYNEFAYSNELKYMIYNDDYKALDVEKLESVGKVVKNPFYEKTRIELTDINNQYSYMSCTYEANVEGNIKYGRTPQNDNEFVLYLSEDLYNAYNVGDEFKLNKEDLEFVTGRGTIDSSDSTSSTTFVLSGIGYSSSVNNYVISNCTKLEQFARFQALKESLYFDSLVLVQGENTNYPLYFNFNEKTHIANYSSTTNLGTRDSYLNYYKYKLAKVSSLPIGEGEETKYIEYYYKNDNFVKKTRTNAVIIGYDIAEYFEAVYEASIYLEKASDIKKLDSLDLSYYQSTITQQSNFFDELNWYLIYSQGVILILVLYFISYIILRKIYETKNETYTIFRTLGVTVSDMKKITLFEVLIQSVLSTLLIYIIMVILGKAFKLNNYLSIFTNISFGTTILYFALTIGMALLIAIKFNKKLFSKSVKESLKEAK